MSCGDFGSGFAGAGFGGSGFFGGCCWRKMSGIVTESEVELAFETGFAETAKDVAAKRTTSPHQCPRIVFPKLREGVPHSPPTGLFTRIRVARVKGETGLRWSHLGHICHARAWCRVSFHHQGAKRHQVSPRK